MRYVALLRGINVGGRTVKMDRLRELFAELKFDHVASYIQTGNIFFDTLETDTAVLRDKVEKYLCSSLGYSVAVCLRTIEELEQLVACDPFSKIPVTSDIRLSVTFLAEPTTVFLSVPYTTPDGGYELVGMTPTELFVVWHLKNGRPGNGYNTLGKMIHVETTTRFWHTVAKILTAAKHV